MRHFFIIIIYLLAIFSKASAQTQIQGKVLNMENAPIPQAVVTVIEKDSKRAVCTILTDTLGMFLIPSCPPNVLLDVAAYGYEDYASEVSAPTYADKLLTIRMKYISLGEVVVTANAKPRMVRNGNKVIIDKLENSPHAKGNDLYSFMRFIPVLKVPTFEGNITLRETAGGSAVLLVNGKNIHIPMDAYLKNVRAEDVERIEVVANPMGEYRVGGNLGVINLIMKKREDEGAQYNLSLTDRQYGLNSQNGVFSINYTKKKTYITSGVYINNSRYKNEIVNENRYYNTNLQTTERYNNKNTNLLFSGYFNLDYELNRKHTIGVQFGAGGIDTDNSSTSDAAYKKSSATVLDSLYRSYSNTYNPDKFSNLNANLNYTFKVNDKGSVFYADLDYRMSRPKNYTHNLYDKIADTDIINKADILQKSQTDVDSYGIWMRYNHSFTPATSLMSGSTFYITRSRNDYAYNYKMDGNYIDDPRKSNHFDFNEYAFSAYTTLRHQWNKHLNTMVSLKLETYKADGEQKSMNESISRHAVNLIPSFNLTYTPSENHIIVIDLSTTKDQPAYYVLNPFKTYLSSTTYRTGNPKLKSERIYMGGLTYNFFEDYSFAAFLMCTKNTYGEFRSTDENNMIKITPMDRKKTFYGAFMLSANKTFFNGYLNLSGEFALLLRKLSNNASTMSSTQRKTIYLIDFSANLTLSKKKMVSAEVSYDYMTSDMGLFYHIPRDHGMSFSLRKRFQNSNLSIGAGWRLDKNNKQYSEQKDYGYTTWQKNYWSIHASYSITFGNTRTRNVQNRGNEELKGRIEKQ